MKTKSRMYRRMEIIPGMLVWITFFSGVVLSIVKPFWVIYFILLFDLYWLFRVAYFLIFLILAWRTYRQSMKTDWNAALRAHNDWQSVYHLICLPFVHESTEIVDTALIALAQSRYPSDRMIVVLGGEGRNEPHALQVMEVMKKKYSTVFTRFLTTIHPDGIAGEIKTKGANLHYMGVQSKTLIDQLNISYERVIVSAFDIDTIVHQDYFSCLTSAYLSHPNRTHSSYQPVVLYNNNIWDSPAPMRLAAFSTTFWLMTELVRPDRLFTFSSHSMPFQALVDVGYWDPTIVSEDSRIFLQCFMRYNGDYEVTPLFIPVSMDTVLAEGTWKSLVNLYKQQRRWAWGVEHFPYLVENFLKNRMIPIGKRLKILWNQTEGMYTWATAPFIILLLGRFPLLFVSDSEQSSIVAQNAPHILELLLNMSFAGIVIIGIVSMTLLPPRSKRHGVSSVLFMILQWLLLPISIILLSSIPAIDAQTRLMFGRYLGFYVTEKSRIAQSA
ncbi:MAG: glycosyltransferase family 2 protein [Patescibacteria group bacterium]